MRGFFDDPRYRQERILLVIVVPVSILLLAGVGTLLYFRETRVKEPPRLLTADRVVESEQDAEAAPKVEQLSAARTAFQEGDYALAAQRLRAEFPGGVESMTPEALELLARIEEKLGNDGEALALYSRAIDSKPSGVLFYRRGVLHRKADRLKEAREDFDNAADLEPSDMLISNERYLLMIQMGDQPVVEEAIRLKMDLGLQSSKIGWAAALAAIALDKGNNDDAVMLLKALHSATDDQFFETLLANPVLIKYQNNPAVLPFFIQTSTLRQR